MESFNGGGGHINYCLLGEHYDVECLRFEEEEEEPDFLTSSLDQKIPFLQMLQTVESPPFLPFQETNLQTLLRLEQLKKPWGETQIQALEPESCVTHDIAELHSPAKSAEDFHRTPGVHKQNATESSLVNRERRKRKRVRATKNKEEVESQRMTHIAVERNRRRQMNDHLFALRSLMPISYVLRGDQASIIGGAINFVKELEQLVQSLEAQKKMSCCNAMEEEENLTPENKPEAAEIRVTVIQSHVNLKIQCPKRPGQLLRTIVALEELKLTVLHLNITSSQSQVLYTFNLKMEDECKLGSSDEIAAAVDGVLRSINGG